MIDFRSRVAFRANVCQIKNQLAQGVYVLPVYTSQSLPLNPPKKRSSGIIYIYNTYNVAKLSIFLLKFEPLSLSPEENIGACLRMYQGIVLCIGEIYFTCPNNEHFVLLYFGIVRNHGS